LASTAAAICITLAILLVPSRGIAGAAFASTVAYAAVQIVAFWYFSRTTGMHVRTMLVPTAGDLAFYRDFVLQMLQDGRRLLRLAPR
jgi:Na+-driven multidrug efflux pump